MAATRCPHCQAALPDDEAVFCVGCGRRVAGWSKAPSGGDGKPLADGAAPTRRAGAAEIQRAVAARRAAADDPAATIKSVVPPSSSAPTGKGMAAAGDETPTAGESLSEELAAVRARGPRLLQTLALGLAVGTLAAGGAFTLYRKLNPPPAAPRRPVTVNLDATPTAPPPARLSLDRGGASSATGRRRGRTTPSAAIAAAPVAATPGSPAATAPAAATAPTTSASAPAAPPATPPAAPATAPPVAAAAPAAPPAADPPTQALAEVAQDDSEQAPLTPAELDEQERARAYADGVAFVLRSHKSQVEACYERAFKSEHSSPSCKVVVDFTVDKGGHARQITTSMDTSGNPLLGHCLEELLGEWQFPRPTSDFPTSYPFVFSGG